MILLGFRFSEELMKKKSYFKLEMLEETEKRWEGEGGSLKLILIFAPYISGLS